MIGQCHANSSPYGRMVSPCHAFAHTWGHELALPSCSTFVACYSCFINTNNVHLQSEGKRNTYQLLCTVFPTPCVDARAYRSEIQICEMDAAHMCEKALKRIITMSSSSCLHHMPTVATTTQDSHTQHTQYGRSITATQEKPF